MNQQFYVGVVENRNDLLKLGRVQVRVFGVHSESLDDVPTSALPWAIPLMPATSASLSGIGHSGAQYLEGSTVFLFFQDGESKQQPIILGGFHGIPLGKNPFNNSNYEGDTASVGASTNNVTSSVKSTNENTLIDSSGSTVVDSSGEPVLIGSDESSELVDISRMVAKYGSNVTLVYNTLKDFGIKNPYAIVAILSNIVKECKFKLVREGMRYSSVDRLRKIFPSKFSSMSNSDAQRYLNNESDLANLVYASRYGNGNAASGDGFAYRGGGFIQLTFKSNYADVGAKIGVNLIASPDKITDPSIAARAAVQYFINRYGGASRLSFSDLNSALNDVTKKVNPGGFANDYPIVETASKLCIIKKDAKADEEKKVEEESAKPNNPENDLKKDATKKEIDSGIVAGVLVSKSTNSNIGFKDPNGKYPLESFLKEQDTNRLSRRSIDNTSVQTKIKNQRKEIRSIGSTFNEPAPAYNGEYPYNHVYTSESGHVQEFDDTPGNERVQTFHTSGSYQETDKFGNVTNKIIGDNFTIVERNGYLYVDGTLRMSIGSDVKLVIAGNLDIEVDGNVNYDVGGDVTWKIGGDLKYGIGGEHSVLSGGNTNIDSALVYLNSGGAAPIVSSARNGKTNDYDIRIPENFIGAETLNFDDAAEEDVVAHQKKAIAAGNMTQQELNTGKAAIKEAPPADTTPPAKNTTEAIPASCISFTGKTDIPTTTQLSTKFTLGMLSTNAVVTHAKVVAQMGLTESQLVCNLKILAENCLDKIKIKYPNMFVTSAFRLVGLNSKSQHPLGMAADMQFTGASKSDYFDIATWIRDNVLYDQLLLEYKTTGTGNPWIHISYKDGGCRKQVLTFMNDTTASQGLRKLQG